MPTTLEAISRLFAGDPAVIEARIDVLTDRLLDVYDPLDAAEEASTGQRCAHSPIVDELAFLIPMATRLAVR